MQKIDIFKLRELIDVLPNEILTQILTQLFQIQSIPLTAIDQRHWGEEIPLEEAESLHGCPDEIPPVIILQNGGRYELFDGYHRVSAFIADGMTEINAIVIPEALQK